MATKDTLGIEKSVLIDAPVEKVFAYYAESENLPEIWPSLLEVKDVQRAPEGWVKHFKWRYKMAGMTFDGSSEVVLHEKNKRIVTEVKGGIESTIDNTFHDEGGKTRVTYSTRYRVPIPLLGRVAERYLAKSNEHEIEVILANLKVRVES